MTVRDHNNYNSSQRCGNNYSNSDFIINNEINPGNNYKSITTLAGRVSTAATAAKTTVTTIAT